MDHKSDVWVSLVLLLLLMLGDLMRLNRVRNFYTSHTEIGWITKYLDVNRKTWTSHDLKSAFVYPVVKHGFYIYIYTKPLYMQITSLLRFRRQSDVWYVLFDVSIFLLYVLVDRPNYHVNETSKGIYTNLSTFSWRRTTFIIFVCGFRFRATRVKWFFKMKYSSIP